MITSALIAEMRREYGDEPKTSIVQRDGDGIVNIFNTGKFPILEGTYQVYLAGVLKSEGADYTIDLDNGDIVFNSTPTNGQTVKVQFKYAEWRDKNWTESVGQSIENLNARGFFRQVVRNKTIFRLSAGITTYSAPSACVDLYELLTTTDGRNYRRPYVNWAYQQDANKVVLGNPPTTPSSAAVSYLRNLQKYSATSATLDTLNDWNEIVKKKSGANFYRSLAGKIAKQGNANIDEGHFSFTNLRAMANDLDNEYERLAARKKPTRPAKDMQWNDPNGGVI